MKRIEALKILHQASVGCGSGRKKGNKIDGTFFK